MRTNSGPLVSVVVTAYNSEETLSRCLMSICRQSYKTLEILIVDDGSTDRTAEIADSFAASDLRFRVCRKKHSGVADSRNYGMREAAGQYLQFVDSDDWIPEKASETFLKAILNHDCEMAISDFFRIVKNKIRMKGDSRESTLISRNEYALAMMGAPANFYYGVVWNKFYRMDIIREHSLHCAETLDWCEDLQFNLEYLLYVKNVYVIAEPEYYYVKRKGSLSEISSRGWRVNARTKKILFEYYRNLYEAAEIYEKNRLKLQKFYFAIARDKTKK